MDEYHRCTGVPILGDAKSFCPNFILFFPNNVQIESLNVKTKTYNCKHIKVSACLITMHSSDISTKSICALSSAPVIFHVQIKFKAATYCYPGSLM